MGEKVKRIEREFVLKSLAERKLSVTARRGAERIELQVLEVDAAAIVAAADRPLPWRTGDLLDVYFVFQNNGHTFSTRVVAVEGENRCRLASPEDLFKGLQREFDRIRRPAGFHVSFKLAGAGSVDLNFPSGPAETDEADLPPRALDPAVIKELVDEFNTRMKAEGAEGRIVMMRNRVPATYEERIMQATGKAFWIPSTDDDFPGREPYSEARVLTKPEIIRYEQSLGTDAALIVSRLADILYQKRRQGIESELWWPMMRGRFFVGYFHILARSGSPPLAAPLLEWTSQMAAVLVHSIERSGYFREAGPQARPYQAEAVDLSASGLLFAHLEKDLYKKLLVHSDIQISLRSGQRRMTIGGRVVRKFMDRERVYIALRFLEISPDDFGYLHEALYGRAFDPQRVVSETSTPADAPPR